MYIRYNQNMSTHVPKPQPTGQPSRSKPLICLLQSDQHRPGNRTAYNRQHRRLLLALGVTRKPTKWQHKHQLNQHHSPQAEEQTFFRGVFAKEATDESGSENNSCASNIVYRRKRHRIQLAWHSTTSNQHFQEQRFHEKSKRLYLFDCDDPSHGTNFIVRRQCIHTLSLQEKP